VEQPLSKDAEKLYALVPSDGKAAGNKSLRDQLRWGEDKYLRVRQELLDAGRIRLGHGRGGSVRRVQGDAQDLLAAVPADGSPIGNITLMRRLRWSDDKYWAVRDALIDDGVLARGAGRGGSVYRVLDGEDEEEAEGPTRDERVPVPSGATIRRESDLYEPIRRVLSTHWARDARLDKFLVEVTARRGGRSNGGRWSRPDLTVVSLRRFKLTGERVFDVYTFEVKLGGAWDITAIYEALGHSRGATYSYAFFHYLGDLDARSEAILAKCAKEARRLGLGLVVSNDPANYDSWNILVEAVRTVPDPEELESFVAAQISEEGHEVLRRWK
jgi:hypothetical protein